MTYAAIIGAVVAFLKGAKDFLIRNWKWVLVLLVIVVGWLYVHSIKNDRDNYKQQYEETLTNYNQYVEAQQKVMEQRQVEFDKLVTRMDEFTKEVDREVTNRNEVIDRLTDSNRTLVDRLQLSTKETADRYKQLPNSDPTIINRYESVSGSLVECSERYSTVAGEGDKLANNINAIRETVERYNKEVEAYNKSQ